MRCDRFAGELRWENRLFMPTAKLPTRRVVKPWGVQALPPPFVPDSDERIGEIWFEPPPGCPLLVKYLFTSERLSIQVHPDDRQARARGLAAGKEECWYILAAEPGAQLGIGTVRPLDGDALTSAAQSGALEQQMQWHDVAVGMFFHIPAGTVHAIGGGVTLIEIQQNSDVTYRLYDYGRPRALHLEDGAAVAQAVLMPIQLQQMIDPNKSTSLPDSDYLGVAHVVGNDVAPLADLGSDMMLVPLDGALTVDNVVAVPGECLWSTAAAVITVGDDARFLAGWFKG